ncbi:MAG: hypothetical protein WC307_05700 [Candidatus Nanoarchaeia archaeon]|jgi:hypothetical protein
MTSDLSPSARGYETEKEIATNIKLLAGIKQKHGFRSYEIAPESVCTGLKLYINNQVLTENDVNFSLKRSSWVVNTFNDLFMVTDTENVAIQSKDYNGKVPTEKVTKDIVHLLMTRRLGFNLKANTMIVCQDKNDPILESRLRSEFNVKIVNSNIFSKYEAARIVGINSLAWNPYDELNNKWVPKKVELGKLSILDDGHSFWKGLKLANLIYADCINNETYKEIKEPLTAMNQHLNPEFYVYLTSNGIGPKSEKFLDSVNGRYMAPADFDLIINNHSFFDEFSRISYKKPFGLIKEAEGLAEASLYASLNDLLNESDKNKLVTEKNLINAVSKSLHKRSYVKL